MMYIHAHHLGKSLVNGSVAIEDEKLTCVDRATLTRYGISRLLAVIIISSVLIFMGLISWLMPLLKPP